MALVQYGGLEVEDLCQFLDQLFGKGSASVDQQHGPTEGVKALEIPLAFNCLGRSSLGLRGQSAGNQGGCQKARQSDPILWIGDRECSNRGRKKKLNTRVARTEAKAASRKPHVLATIKIKSK
jgi:hypothetical protein